MRALLLVFLISAALGDVYMHNPRGSNDRLAEPNANRQNQERLFDSQNNAKGGYSWGPKMYFYTGSILSIEWTNQHSCGNQNSDCDIVLQYMCDPALRDGVPDGDANNPKTPSYCDPQNPGGCSPSTYDTKNGKGEFVYGVHESYDFYDKCYCRERNKGLFTADQTVNNNRGATATRQNNNGNNVRPQPTGASNANHGYECPEERDYYPYWHPTPWKDIAILTSRLDYCPFMVANSENVKGRFQCVFQGKNYPVNSQNQRIQAANNAIDCNSQGGAWIMTPPNGDPAPACVPAPWTRDNHLGNGVDGYTLHYNWTIPNSPSPGCVLRLRYNITTKDLGETGKKRFYDLDQSFNGKQRSPVTNDPVLEHSPNLNPPMTPTAHRLKLAINTAQTGRTFQDRSHAFEIRPRPGIDNAKRIHNLNVRGKRGNIVQAYPAVEYDFVPQILHVKVGDYIHVQWTGALDGAYPNNQDGEGKDKTDRSNMVSLALANIGGNYLLPMKLGNSLEMPWSPATMQLLAWIGQTQCDESKVNNDQDVENCAKLNGAPTAYFDAGLLKVEKAMTFNYMGTRNNNFSNRSQKGQIVSEQVVQTFAIVLLSLSSAALVGGAAIAAVVKLAPASGLATAA